MVEYKWVEVTTSAPWAARDGAGLLAFRDRLWLLGGWNPNDKSHFPLTCNNEVWSTTDGLGWQLVRPNTFINDSFDPEADWEGRHTGGYVVFDDAMWLIGGDCNQGHHHADVWRSTDGCEWEQVNRGEPAPWGPRALHYTVVHDGRIWVMGGQAMPMFDPAAGEAFYRDVWCTSDGVNWRQVQPVEPYWPQRGMIGGHAVHRGRIYVMGGGTYDTPGCPQRQFFNDVWSSADGVHWTCHTDNAPWAPRQYHEVASWDDKLWVLEGYSGGKGFDGRGNRNDVWYSADDGATWTQLPDTPWLPRHAASVMPFDDALWVIAGNNMTPDVWKLVKA